MKFPVFNHKVLLLIFLRNSYSCATKTASNLKVSKTHCCPQIALETRKSPSQAKYIFTNTIVDQHDVVDGAGGGGGGCGKYFVQDVPGVFVARVSPSHSNHCSLKRPLNMFW